MVSAVAVAGNDFGSIMMNIGGQAWDPLTSIGRAILLIQHAPTIAHTSLELSHSQFYITLHYYPEFYLLILSNQLFWKLPIAPPPKKKNNNNNNKHLPQTKHLQPPNLKAKGPHLGPLDSYCQMLGIQLPANWEPPWSVDKPQPEGFESVPPSQKMLPVGWHFVDIFRSFLSLIFFKVDLSN